MRRATGLGAVCVGYAGCEAVIVWGLQRAWAVVGLGGGLERLRRVVVEAPSDCAGWAAEREAGTDRDSNRTLPGVTTSPT